jgi:fatty-acyl-CoA synthase
MAGWPVIGMQVRVVDPEMNDVPRDMQTIGEIVTCGDHVMEGYFREPEATAAVMSGPWFHTGDMAVWDEETSSRLSTARKRSSSAAAKTSRPSKWRRPFSPIPEVFECAVVAAPDETWGEIPAAIVVRKPGRRSHPTNCSSF